MIILLHSSKTMRVRLSHVVLRQPTLLSKAEHLAMYLKTCTEAQLASCMHVSATLAHKTHQQIAAWNTGSAAVTPAMDSFIGDIYSGLQASSFSDSERAYADQHLRILSGLYGILRPLDGIAPYRLEMGYRFPDEPFKNLYNFWQGSIAQQLPVDETIINLAAIEYSKVITPYVEPTQIISPKFLTFDSNAQEPTFVAVHAKIARGAFAHWMIVNRIEDAGQLTTFSDIGYQYNRELSSPLEPVFVCQEFGGKGLSMRLEK